MINWTRVRALRNDVGADEFEEIVDIFLDEVDDIAANLRTVTDDHGLELHLHALKNAALNLGFIDLSDLCQKAEAQAGSGQAASVDLKSLFTCLDTSLSQFKTQWVEEVTR